jgi:small subunit ribosomal protein S1
MTTNSPRRDFSSPPPLDEGYWSALLNDGEYTDHSPHDSGRLEAAHANHSAGTHHNGTHKTPDHDWVEIAQLMNQDEVIEMAVIGFNRGGLLVEWHSLHGFVPASQLMEFPATGTSIQRRNALMNLVGQKLSLRVIELNAEQNRLILSERAASVGIGERARVLHDLQPGDTVSGFVTNLCDFGAFVDLGGLEGLIHISELSWGRVGHPADILERGEEVDVYILDVDRDAGRIALSYKRMHPDPWATVNERFRVGQIVEGTITNVVDFGAFACIEDGLEGLIHVSEMAEGHFLHPRNVVNEGQVITARVLSIDSHARRLGLSLRLNTQQS